MKDEQVGHEEGTGTYEAKLHLMEALTVSAWLRWDCVRRLLPHDAHTILEIGAGVGGVGAMLSREYEYTGLEPDATSYAIAARRNGGRVIQRRIEDHEGRYDIVCAFEVLEHIPDDVEALRRWREHSTEWLLLSVPMNPDRFGPADERAGHFRRYTRERLTAALTEAGWRPMAMDAWGYPAANALERVRQGLAAREGRKAETMLERTNASGRWLQPSDGLAVLTWTAALPFRLVQRPFRHSELGVGLVALAQL